LVSVHFIFIFEVPLPCKAPVPERTAADELGRAAAEGFSPELPCAIQLPFAPGKKYFSSLCFYQNLRIFKGSGVK